MKKTIFILLFVLITSLSFASEIEVETLRGVKAINVEIVLSSELQDIGIDENTLRTDTELKLRLAGIKVISEKEWLDIDDVNDTVLCLNINGYVEDNSGLCIFNISTKLMQVVSLYRDNKIRTFVGTWSVAMVGCAGRLTRRTYIKETCKNQVDEFVNAYLSVNPK